MKMISERTFKFLAEQYEQHVHDLLDDPDEQWTGWTPADFADHYQTLVAVANDIGKNFWQVCWEQGTDYEIDRLQQMCREAGIEYVERSK